MSINDIIIKLDKLSNVSVDSALEKACLIVENSAKEKVPVDTGNLRSSITHTVENNVIIENTIIKNNAVLFMKNLLL